MRLAGIMCVVLGSGLAAAEPTGATSAVGPAARTYAVELHDAVVPAWFGDLTIVGLRRADSATDADLLVSVTAEDPHLTWTAWAPTSSVIRDTRLTGARGHQRLLALLGTGDLQLVIEVRDRVSGRVITTLDLSRTRSLRWDPPEPQDATPPMWRRWPVSTPAATARAWERQAWVDAFANAEHILPLRLGAPP